MDTPKENKQVMPHGNKVAHTRGMPLGLALLRARAIHPDAHVCFDQDRHPKSPCRIGYFGKGGKFIDRAGGATWPVALERVKSRLPKGGRL